MITISASHQLRATTLALIGALLALALLGSNGDGGCSADFVEAQPPEQLCLTTGGTWGTGDFWPPPCGKDATTKGPAAKPGENVCTCPTYKAHWKDGVGCTSCESSSPTYGTSRWYCVHTGGTWGAGDFWPTPCGEDPATTKGAAAKPGEDVCTCPADEPNWIEDYGCIQCHITRDVCTTTGGKWGPGTNWPVDCGEDPAAGPGSAADPGENVCACPADKPTWDWIEGCQACKPHRQVCTETGGTWGSAEYWSPPCGDDPLLAYGPASYGEPVCLCPADKPNWTEGTGCRKCTITAGDCDGDALDCSDFDGNELACTQQEGCTWDRADQECDGSADSCSEMDNEWRCSQQRGCGWNPVSSAATPRESCHGCEKSCSDFNHDYYSCWMQRGCHFDYEDEDCDGDAQSCNYIYDKLGCMAQAGCRWEQS